MSQAAHAPGQEDFPLVTIVLPVLNEERFIERCLRSVLEQDYPAESLEVLVFDGGSTDRTREIVSAMAAPAGSVQLLDNPGRTQVKAFNLGVKLARGRIVVRVDGHAEYDRSYVRKCVETLRQTGAGNVGGMCKTEPGGPGLAARAVAVAYTERFGIGGARFRVGGKPGPTDSVPFGAFPIEVFGRVGLMSEELPRGEDNEFNARLRSAGLAVYFNPDIVSTYYARPTLGAMLGQMFGNGLYHVPTLLVNPRGCSPRHLAPFFFVLAILLGVGLGFLWPMVWWACLAMLTIYALADCAASLSAASRRGWIYLPVLIWFFPTLHVCYGLGTLAGVLRFLPPAILHRKGRRTMGARP